MYILQCDYHCRVHEHLHQPPASFLWSLSSHSHLQPFPHLDGLCIVIRYLIFLACHSRTVKWVDICKVQHVEPCLACSKHCIRVCLIKIRNYPYFQRACNFVGKIRWINEKEPISRTVWKKLPLERPGWEETGAICPVLSSSHLSYFSKQLVILLILCFKKLRLIGIKVIKSYNILCVKVRFEHGLSELKAPVATR